MRTLTLREAKANFSELIERACRGEEVIISRRGKPLARLVPIGTVKGKRRPGALRGKFSVGQRFFEPLPRKEFSAWGN
jgi:prevent-host-death family protein